MGTVGFGPLEQREVLARLHELHEVGEHPCVGLDLNGVPPARYELRQFLKGRVDDVGDAFGLRSAQGRAAGFAVRQIAGDPAGPGWKIRLPAGKPDDLRPVLCLQSRQHGAAD